MKRLACLAVVAILAACGSDSNGPIEKPSTPFTGTWSGNAYYSPISADTLNFTLVANEGGGSVSGSVYYVAPWADTVTFTGTSTSTALDFVALGLSTYTYTGTYVTSDSIDGGMDFNGFGGDGLSLKKISAGSGGNFGGTWSGLFLSDSSLFVLVATQTGTAVTGSGIYSSNGAIQRSHQFTGTSTPPTLSFTWHEGASLLRYTGTYITSDSIAGGLRINGIADVALSLKKH